MHSFLKGFNSFLHSIASFLAIPSQKSKLHSPLNSVQHITYIFQTASNENVIYPHTGCWRPEYDGIAGSRSQRGSLGRYGDYGCDTPWELVESAVKAMATRQDVDFLLWTGWVVYIEITDGILVACQRFTALLNQLETVYWCVGGVWFFIAHQIFYHQSTKSF